jgi:hypothetical protein
VSESRPGPTSAGADPGASREEDLRLWDWVLSYAIQPQDVSPEDLDILGIQRALEIAYNRRPEVVQVRGDDLYVEVVVREGSSSEATGYPYPRLDYAMKRAGVGAFEVTHHEARPPDDDWEPWLHWIAKQNEGKI